MFKFNNNHIFTGYLKQKLANFYLPKYKVYTREQQEYFDTYHREHPSVIGTIEYNDKTFNSSGQIIHPRYVQYIKDGFIQEYVIKTAQDQPSQSGITAMRGSWVNIGQGDKQITKAYNYNKPDLNYTRQLIIKDNVYDSYTHEYLGDYLRFKRDYENIDLMPLYNCFSDRICSRLHWTFKLTENDDNLIEFDAEDSNYKIFMLPVKLFKDYTIAIESEFPVEICCGVYGKYQDTRDKFDEIPRRTYMIFNSTKFNKPEVYTKLNQFSEQLVWDLATELVQNECDLKMFIKVPAVNASSIVVLEGNYATYNDAIFTKNTRKANHIVTNYDTDALVSIRDNNGILLRQERQDFSNFKPITQLQLLRLNTGESYPFADRLVEYLLDMAITPTDEISDNIQRVKTVMHDNEILFENKALWENKMQCIAYDYMFNSAQTNTYDGNHDNLGYIDRDIDSTYSAGGTTIASVDIYKNGDK